jgi:hypothetical protein
MLHGGFHRRFVPHRVRMILMPQMKRTVLFEPFVL